MRRGSRPCVCASTEELLFSPWLPRSPRTWLPKRKPRVDRCDSKLAADQYLGDQAASIDWWLMRVPCSLFPVPLAIRPPVSTGGWLCIPCSPGDQAASVDWWLVACSMGDRAVSIDWRPMRATLKEYLGLSAPPSQVPLVRQVAPASGAVAS